MAEKAQHNTYTCNEYRAEMILVSLHKRLEQQGLSEDDKRLLVEEIRRLEEEMGM
jgi:RNA polymerase-interacting CarD/CdnL/TRCF family regulator